MDWKRRCETVHFFPRPPAAMVAAMGRAAAKSGVRRSHDGSRLRLRRPALDLHRFAAAGTLFSAECVHQSGVARRFSTVARPRDPFSGGSGGPGPEADPTRMAGRRRRIPRNATCQADDAPKKGARPDSRLQAREDESVSELEVNERRGW